MALTYVNIASTTLGSSQTTVTFSGISSAYTDLELRISARTDRSAFPSDQISIRLNNVATNNNYGRTSLNAGGTSFSSNNAANISYVDITGATATTSTTNTFGSCNVYLANYTTTTTSKQLAMLAVTEISSATSNTLTSVAGTFVPSSVINRIDISTLVGTNFIAGSSFYLYGIKNS